MQGSFNVWTDHKKGHSKVRLPQPSLHIWALFLEVSVLGTGLEKTQEEFV